MADEELIEDRRIYEVEGRLWMVLTAEELRQFQTDAPHLIRYVNDEACSEVTIRRKVKES